MFSSAIGKIQSLDWLQQLYWLFLIVPLSTNQVGLYLFAVYFLRVWFHVFVALCYYSSVLSSDIHPYIVKKTLRHDILGILL